MVESKYKLLGYRVSNINVTISDTFPTGVEKISQTIDVSNNFSGDDKRFVEVVLDIHVFNERKDFMLDLVIKGGFKADDDMPQELFEKLSQKNGPAILFPFARAIITSYTAQANIPAVILPTINFS